MDPFPPQLGRLSKLKLLTLQNNQLSGTVPPELGQLTNIEQLLLADNKLTGSLPMSFTQLESLRVLVISGQDLCAPQDDQFQQWLKGLEFFDGETCTPVGVNESFDRQSLPEHFVVHGNYPNPFLEKTQLVFDLPWESLLQLEVVDVIGRRVLTLPAKTISAGWGKRITIHGESLSPGIYLYRLIADAPINHSLQTGRIIKLRD